MTKKRKRRSREPTEGTLVPYFYKISKVSPFSTEVCQVLAATQSVCDWMVQRGFARRFERVLACFGPQPHDLEWILCRSSFQASAVIFDKQHVPLSASPKGMALINLENEQPVRPASSQPPRTNM